MMSVYSLLFVVMLFSEMNGTSVIVAMPSNSLEEGATEQEGLDSILPEQDITEHAIVPLTYMRSLNNDGTLKVIVIPDMNMDGRSIRGMKSASTRSHPMVSERSLDRTPNEFTFKLNKREKDLDMLRCMIGRVYRPCWEV